MFDFAAPQAGNLTMAWAVQQFSLSEWSIDQTLFFRPNLCESYNHILHNKFTSYSN